MVDTGQALTANETHPEIAVPAQGGQITITSSQDIEVAHLTQIDGTVQLLQVCVPLFPYAQLNTNVITEAQVVD